jgi:hypothetical protein
MPPRSGKTLNVRRSSYGLRTTRSGRGHSRFGRITQSPLDHATGKGKRGGARVIYYNILEDGEIWLLIAYSKAKFDNLPTAFLNQLREAIQHG